MASKDKLRAKLDDARESITEYEADLSASEAREGILRNELRDVKQKWGQVIAERDKLLRQVQQIRVALEPVNKAVNPDVGSFTFSPKPAGAGGAGGQIGPYSNRSKPTYAQGGVVGTPGAPLPAWWNTLMGNPVVDPYGR